MARTVRTEGFRELDEALGQLNKATAKNVLRRAAIEALEPMRAKAEERAPVLSGQLQTHVLVSPRQKSGRALRRFREAKDTVVMFLGPSRNATVQGQMQEFGTRRHPPQPFMRPAWDAEKDEVVPRLAAALEPQIEKAAARAARKAARLAAKGG